MAVEPGQETRQGSGKEGDIMSKRKPKETVVQHDYIEPDLRPLAVPIGGLKHDPHQVKHHGERSIEEIRKSLKEHGQKTPIVIDENDVVKKGNGILEAAKQLGWTHLAAVRSADNDRELRKYAIRDNRTAEFADWMAAQVLGEVKDLGLDPIDVGWNEEEYQALAGVSWGDEPNHSNGESPDDFPEVDENISTEHTCPKCGYRWSGGK